RGLRGELHSVEIFDPRDLPVREAGALALARAEHTSTLLAGGDALVTGGFSAEGGGPVGAGEGWVAARGPFGQAAPVAERRYGHQAVRLDNDRLMVVGGWGHTANVLASAEIYDPDRDVWRSAPGLSLPRVGHTATLLRNGCVLVVGGNSRSQP